jgi:hypothetical protein
MSKLFAFVGCLVLGSLAVNGGTYTNTGSATTSCAWSGPAPVPSGPLLLNATGTNISLICPDPWVGPSVIGSVGPLMTQASIGRR